MIMVSSLIKCLVLIACVLLSGCAPKIDVTIDSISSIQAKLQNRFILLPNDEEIPPTDLQFLEYARYIENALVDIGFEKAMNYDDANVAIFLDYGISDPLTYTYTYTVPVYGQTGVSTNTSGSVYNCGNSAIYSSNTTYYPTYGIVGLSERLGTEVVYVRHFSLLAADFKEFRSSSNIAELWNTKVTSVGASCDLREVFPALVVAAKEYIASNTCKRVSVTISQDDKRITELVSRQ